LKSRQSGYDDQHHGFTMREIYNLIYTLDWLSLMIADRKGKKSDEIKNINKLKNFLSNKN
jgi:hypothetical protein